jgi:hypothetical protein
MYTHLPSLTALGFLFAVLPGSFKGHAPARAQDYKVPEHLLEGTHCHCRANGALFPQGEEVCMMGQMRVCGMSQNVSSWVQTGRTCPTSSRAAPRFAALAIARFAPQACPRG